MTYFTFQRLLTFLGGIIFLYLSYFSYTSKMPLVHYGLAFILACIGIYIVIASLVPYKETTKGVAEIVLELLVNIFIEFIPNLISITLRAITHLFTH